MALLPPEIQQQVQQQGTGVLDASLVSQLQQLASQLAPPAPQQPPQPAALELGGLLGSAPAPLQPQPSYPQQQPSYPQQQVARPAAALPPQPASVFLKQQQRQQPPAAPTLGASPGGVPLLRSEPVPPPKPEPAAAAAALAAARESSDKAQLLVALAKSVGVSNEELARALMGGQAGAPSAPQPSPSDGAPQPSSSQLRGPDVLAQQLPLRQASDSLARPSSSVPGADGLLPVSAAVDGSGPLSSLGGATSLQAGVGQLQPAAQTSAFGSVFRAVSGGQAAPAAGPAAPAPAPAAAAAGPSRQPLDLEQLQSAVQNAGLNSGFASDASLLLQLVAAVEAAQRQAAPGKDRMHTLCLKLFNVRTARSVLHAGWLHARKGAVGLCERAGCCVLHPALWSGAECLEAASVPRCPDSCPLPLACRCCLQCTPDSLPSNILDQLGSWVAQNSTLLEGASAAPAVVVAALPRVVNGIQVAGQRLQTMACVQVGCAVDPAPSLPPPAPPQAPRAPAACRWRSLRC